jgi:hypothetical protein
MRILEKDFYYGAALAQIVDYPTYTSINRVSDKNGLYLINNETKLFVKYSAVDEEEWRFTFKPDDFDDLSEEFEYYLALICAGNTICLLSNSEVDEIIDTDSDSSQWIAVNSSNSGQHKVRGSNGSLSKLVPQNAFPKKMFSDVSKQQKSFAWPELSKINIYSLSYRCTISTTDRLFDLADGLMRFEGEREVYFGLVSYSHLWKNWDEENLIKIESRITYDLEFDGYTVDIKRITEGLAYCSTEFIWKLSIS